MTNTISRLGPHRRLRPGPLVFWVVMIALSLVFLLPLLGMVSTSIKTPHDAATSSSIIPNGITFDAYLPLFQWTGKTPVMRWFFNSVLVAVGTTVLVVTTAAPAAYAFARFTFRGRNLVFALVVGTIFLPGFVFLIPNYVIISEVGLLDNLLALMLPAVGGAFGVFFLRQFFLSLPRELEEAALLDGANQWQIFRTVMLPLAKPGIATLSIIAFLGSWNDFMWPLYVLYRTENLTLPAGLPLLQDANMNDIPKIMAAAVIACVPVLIVFIFAQRRIIESVATAGLKG